MAEPNTKGKFPLTIYMDADLAKRLAVAAEGQKRPKIWSSICWTEACLGCRPVLKDKIPYT